jgi:N-carbamoylputrescine amidase
VKRFEPTQVESPGIRVALVQHKVTGDLRDNLRRGLEATRSAAAGGAKLVVFPELGFTPFYPQHPMDGDPRPMAETVPGPTTDAFTALARELGIVVVLNVFERQGNATYDCSPVIDADGSLLGKTRMVHITDYTCFHERQYYRPGDLGAPVFETRVGRIGVAICYDRHFPEYMRALAVGGAEIVVVPQAGVVDEWTPGLFEGEMCTTAFQNGYFIVLCNRVGVEDRLQFSGESFVCGPDGRVRDRAPRGKEGVLMSEIDLREVERSHARKILLKDRRPELYAEWVHAPEEKPESQKA